MKSSKSVLIYFVEYSFKVTNLNEADTINDTLKSFDKDVGDDTILSDQLTLSK